jgi:hypothetical protein
LINNPIGARLRKEGKEDKKEPLAPYPSRAMLTTRKAKWCHWATERRRMMEISRVRVAAEVRKMPRKRKVGAGPTDRSPARGSEFGMFEKAIGKGSFGTSSPNGQEALKAFETWGWERISYFCIPEDG